MLIHNRLRLLNSKSLEVYRILTSIKSEGRYEANGKDVLVLKEAPALSYDKKVEKWLAVELNPSDYGWGEDSEYPRVEWMAKTIASYLIYDNISIFLLIVLLKSLNYHGLFGLFEIIKTPNLDTLSTDIQIEYYKTVAKYFKTKGDLVSAQKNYRKLIYIANKFDKELLPYTLVLLAKLYSDYWQRKGLFLAFSKIVFDRMSSKLFKASNKISRKAQICADTYAKEVYLDDPELGKKIFDVLIRNTYKVKDNERRVQFRYIECQISYELTKSRSTKLESLLIQYEKLLSDITNNPKVLYIRKTHLLSFYRQIFLSPSYDYQESEFLSSKLESLKSGEAILSLETVIKESIAYNDRKFTAFAYYEKSFWLQRDIDNLHIEMSIDCLVESYNIFSAIDKSSIINSTYVNVIERLAKLYVQIKNWDKAIYYYNSLYSYLSFLTNTLEEDYLAIAKTINDEPNEVVTYSEFSCLTISEKRLVKESLITDYQELSRRLISYSNNIKNIQKHQLDDLVQYIYFDTKLFAHDITRNINAVKNSLLNISNEHKTNQKLIANIGSLILEINKSKETIERYEKSSENRELTLKSIDITKEINNYISFSQKHTFENVTLDFSPPKPIYINTIDFLTTKILDNVLENSIEVAQRNSIKEILIIIELKEVENIVYLIVNDNSGDYEYFTSVIDMLNARNTPNKIPSKKNKNKKGTGLYHIKFMLDKFTDTCNWMVIPDGDNRKKLFIPLSTSFHTK